MDISTSDILALTWHLRQAADPAHIARTRKAVFDGPTRPALSAMKESRSSLGCWLAQVFSQQR